MKTIYVDNFRGFARTYLDLLGVTYLVGENSSGKTSLLWAARTLCDTNFMFSLDFSQKIGGLGNFHDLISANSGDKSSFLLGITETTDPVDRKSKPGMSPAFVAILLEFANAKGMPDLVTCTIQVDNFWAALQFRGKGKTARLTVDREKPLPPNSQRPFSEEWQASQQPELSSHTLKLRPGVPFIYSLSDLFGQYDRLTRGRVKGAKDAHGDRQAIPDVIGAVLSTNENIAWVAPIRTKPKRTYDEFNVDYSSEGEHTPYLIQRLLTNRKTGPRFGQYLSKVGRLSNLFRAIHFQRLGRGEVAPFALDVVLNSAPLSINNVGYGVSQSLPIFVEIFARQRRSWFAIQQPEVHLHPRAQAALGELIYEIAATEEKVFVIETHSDYLMDRFRLMMRESKRQGPSSQIVYCESEGGQNTAYSMRIGEDGTLPAEQPSGYRKFFINEALRLLELG